MRLSACSWLAGWFRRLRLLMYLVILWFVCLDYAQGDCADTLGYWWLPWVKSNSQARQNNNLPPECEQPLTGRLFTFQKQHTHFCIISKNTRKLVTLFSAAASLKARHINPHDVDPFRFFCKHRGKSQSDVCLMACFERERRVAARCELSSMTTQLLCGCFCLINLYCDHFYDVPWSRYNGWDAVYRVCAHFKKWSSKNTYRTQFLPIPAHYIMLWGGTLTVTRKGPWLWLARGHDCDLQGGHL
jgi:hypothetical protein